MKKNKKIIFISLLVLLFIINTILVKLNVYENIDDFIHANVLLFHSEITTKIMHILTFFGSTKFIVALASIVFIIYMILKRKNYAFTIVITLIVSTIINNVIKNIFKRTRPSYITVVENTFSYPSGHMMASTTLYGFFIYLIIKSNMPKNYKILYSIFLGLLIVLIGISRIYLGAHFFSDILGALICSITILVSFTLLNDKYKWI